MQDYYKKLGSETMESSIDKKIDWNPSLPENSGTEELFAEFKESLSVDAATTNICKGLFFFKIGI